MRCSADRRLPSPWPFLLLGLLFVLGGGRAASAQTVIVRSAPQGSTIQLVTDTGPAATAAADANGDATLTVPPQPAEATVIIHVDFCTSSLTVHVISRGLQPAAPAPGCVRVDVPSIFAMRSATTFVIDIEGNDASVHVAQGPPPRSWVRREGDTAPDEGIQWGTPPRGFVVAVGGGLSSFADATTKACGDVSGCDQGSFGPALTVAADLWVMRFLAATALYARPADVTAHGAESTFSFDSRLHARMVAFGAKAAAISGPVRLYGMGGLNRHQATLTSSQTVNDSTVTVNGATQTVKGGTQTYGQKTQGWNWWAGGGVEAWANNWFAFYGEFSRMKIKGTPAAGGEGGIDDQATVIVAGVRVRIGS